jgi:hypothetical protein
VTQKHKALLAIHQCPSPSKSRMRHDPAVALGNDGRERGVGTVEELPPVVITADDSAKGLLKQPKDGVQVLLFCESKRNVASHELNCFR